MTDRSSTAPSGTLRLMQTSDLHMQLLPFDYLADRPAGTRSLLGLAGPIRSARSEGIANILLDGGDFLQGSALADFLAEQRLLPHPMIAAFNHLGVDVVTLGNHEFEYGLDYLTEVLGDLQAEVVSANLSSGPAQTFVAPWTIIERDIPCSDGVLRPVRVGVIGFAPPQVVDWNADQVRHRLISEDAVSSALTQIPRLRRAGADIVVALCHGGPSGDPAHFRMENPAAALAALRGVDVVLMGHLHGTFPGADFAGIPDADPERGCLGATPAMMPGAHGSHLGVMDLALEIDADGDWRIAGHEARLVPAEPAETGPEALSGNLPPSLIEAHETVRARLSRTICTSPLRLSTHFASIGVDDTADLIAQVQTSAVRHLLAETAYADLPVLASTAPFRAGGHSGPDNYCDIPEGPLRLRDCYALVPFDNPICALLRRGWQIRAWLERSVAFFARVQPGTRDQPLVDGRIAPYHLDTIHGIDYEIDLTRPRQACHAVTEEVGRIRDITLDGAPLCDDTLVVVATNSYRAHGGGGHVQGDASDILATTDIGMRQMLIEGLSRGTVRPRDAGPGWRFAPVDGASVVFDSAPEAADHLPPCRRLAPLEGLRDGFARFRLALD